MKVIVAGGRNLYVKRSEIEDAIRASGFQADEIVSGGSPGIDECGEQYADALIAFPGGTGTANIVSQMQKLGKPVYVVENTP